MIHCMDYAYSGKMLNKSLHYHFLCRLVERNVEEHKRFVKNLKQSQKEFSARAAALLENPREVKRLCDLLILEQKAS